MNVNPRTIIRIVVLALFFATTASIGAIDLTIEFVDGFLDLRDGTDWLELDVGDTITDAAIIRLEENTIAEIYAPGVKLTLTKPGIYQISDLINQTGEQRSVGLASVVGGKVASLFADRKSDSQAAVMGVRGAKSESTVQWMTGDTAELVGAGKERLAENEIDEAFELFGEAYDFAELDEETEVLFYLGYTAYLLGEVGTSADYLGEIIDVDVEAEFFPHLLLLYGQVLTETFAFEDALEWIGTYRETETIDDSVRQTALLLEGVNYKALGQLEDARRSFASSRAIDPSTDVAKAAEALDSELE